MPRETLMRNGLVGFVNVVVLGATLVINGCGGSGAGGAGGSSGGKGGGSGGQGASCPNVTACGGDVAGTWTATSNGDGTYADNTTTTGTEQLALAAACLVRSSPRC